MKLIDLLREQKNMQLKGNIYHVTQIEMAYNSNRIEGSSLTSEQTRYIYETKTVIGDALVNDVLEVINHFKAFDYMLDTADMKLSEEIIKKYHYLLKDGTEDASKDWFNVGEYKKVANQVGNIITTDPQDVSEEIENLLLSYNASKDKSLKSIVEMHYRFEAIHPFQDGNGRVGRLIMFKECLKNNISPLIIHDTNKAEYYKGLQEYTKDKSMLCNYCRNEQQEYRSVCKSLFPEVSFSDNLRKKKDLDIDL